MNKRLITILIAVFSVIIACETFFLLSHCDKTTSDAPDISAGTAAISNIAVTINDTQIPSYKFQGAVYIAAEDLHNFGFEMITNSDKSISLNYSKDTAPSPADGIEKSFSSIPDNSKLQFFKNGFTLNGKSIQCYVTYDYHLIPAKNLKSVASLTEDESKLAFILGESSDNTTDATAQPASNAATAQSNDVK